MAVVKAIHKLSDVLDKAAEVLIVIMILMMVVITGAQVVCRIFFEALPWSEEATRYLLIWATMFGAGCVYKHGGHISITALHSLFPEKGKKFIQILIHVLCAILFCFIIYYGYQYFGRQGAQVSASMHLPMRWVYVCIPIGSALMLIHAVDAILQIITGKGENH